MNELIWHFGDRTIVVNASFNQLENWQMNFQNKQSFIAFSSILKRLVQAFQYLGFTADHHSTTIIKKAKEKTPHHLVLKWTEHCLTELSSDPTLVDFQQWLELQAQIYDNVSRESNQRTISSQASKFVNSNNLQTKPNNSNLPLSVNKASTENSRKHWNFAPQQKEPSFSQNVQNITFSTKRSCEKCKQEHSITTCPEYQLCSPGDRYNFVSQNNLCTNCLSNKHHKQSCPSQKRCQVCSGFHHTTLHDLAKQIKRPTAAFSTEVVSGSNPTASSSSKDSSQKPNKSSQQKSETNKAPNSRYGQTFHKQSHQNVQRRNLNGNAINQSFSINQCSETPKNWYEKLQLFLVSFLKGDKAFDTYALIDPGSQFRFVLDAIAEFLELPRETQQSEPLQFLNTENSMSLPKIVEPVTITPYKSTEISLELSRTFSTPSLNVAAGKFFELNQICDAFNSLRHIHFPNIADDKIGALLGVNAFEFTYPTHVILGNQNQPFGVKTKLVWTLAGEYENRISATNQNQYKSTEISLELSRTFSTPSLNVAAAKVFELNQICDAFNSLRHIHFPNIADGKIGALLGVNAFAFTYPTQVIPGNQNQPFGVNTKLVWTLAGEYENRISATTQLPASQQKGPFYIEYAKGQIEKHYGLIFTCLVTRCVHLEACPSLNTDTFLNAYQRFVSRRCLPTTMLSDNGRTIIGASEELKRSVKRLDNDKLYKAMAATNTTWKFNRPYGPHFGGIWERLIQTPKRILLIILGYRRLSLDVFRTFLVETEAILNSRPLKIVADFPKNEMPFTPNLFLINRPFNSLPPGKFDSQEPASFKSWKNMQQMVNHFWKRLVKEYLPTLLKRSKWSDSGQTPLRVNDIVWILKDMTPRGIWPLGRVREVYPGREGQHRVVKVKTAYGTYVRPVSALARVLAD